jgi:magnesium transporter
MISFYKAKNGSLQSLAQVESDCWINIYPPFSQEQLKKLGEQFHIPLDYLFDSLDVDERSRYEREEGIDLIVMKIPIPNPDRERDSLFITIPIGIILTGDAIITISSYENPVIDSFINMNVKNFDTANLSRMVLQLFERNVYYFLYYLKETNNERNNYEKELYHSMRNEELAKLLKIEKSLVYFLTSLRSNELMMMKMQRTDFLSIRQDEESVQFFDDVLVDNSQALEMANVYTNILSGTMDAFASIISNNLNMVMKRLTSVTIVLMLPTLIASFYGMNVKLPFSGNLAFYGIVMLSIILSSVLILYFLWKRWF